MHRVSPISRRNRVGCSDDGAMVLIGRYGFPSGDNPPRPSLVVVDSYFWPFIYGPFLNRFCTVGGSVVAEAKIGPPRALALGAVTGRSPAAALGLLDRLFADPAAMAIKTDIAAFAAKGLVRIAYGFF